MGSPVNASNFTAVTTATNACEGFKMLLRQPGLINQFLGWLLDGDGEISESAADGIAEYFTPVGSIVLWGGVSIPSSRWLVCNGQAVSRTTYSTLFTRYGTTWGVGDGSTTFNLPNLQGKFPRGADAATPVGSSGGSDTVSLAEENVPDVLANHFHGTGRRAGGGAIDDGNNDFEFIMREWTKTGTHHYNTLQGDDSLSGNGDFTDTGNAATTNAINDTTAGPPADGEAFDIKPAFTSTYFIIKAL